MKIKNKKNNKKSTCDEYVDNLSPERKEEFNRGYEEELKEELFHKYRNYEDIMTERFRKDKEYCHTFLNEILRDRENDYDNNKELYDDMIIMGFQSLAKSFNTMEEFNNFLEDHLHKSLNKS